MIFVGIEKKKQMMIVVISFNYKMEDRTMKKLL